MDQVLPRIIILPIRDKLLSCVSAVIVNGINGIDPGTNL